MSGAGILFEHTGVDHPRCPSYYSYCTFIELNFEALFNYSQLLLDLGVTTVIIETMKTYQLFDTYLTEYRVCGTI